MSACMCVPQEEGGVVPESTVADCFFSVQAGLHVGPAHIVVSETLLQLMLVIRRHRCLFSVHAENH